MIDTFPVNLLLKNKKCLVVGGGNVAARKIRKLAEAGARIVVVAPDVSARLLTLADNGAISLRQRAFEESDLDEAFLVYAATDDAALNRRIAGLAERKGVLACAVDGGWHGGSFITPASFADGGMTVAVSSHGVACRKARLVKESLNRHIAAVEHADLMVMGIDHRVLSLAKREKLRLAGNRLEHLGAMLTQLRGICGFVLLDTCNRFEFIAVADCNEALLELVKLTLRFDSLRQEQYYLKTGFDAFSHVCNCLAGSLSQHFGETHIAGQVKRACVLARDKGWAGPVFELVHHHALHVARRIRNQTSGLLAENDVEHDVMRLLTAEFPDLRHKRILLVGTGVVGTRLQEMFAGPGCDVVWLYHARRPRETSPNCRVFTLAALPEMLPEADIVICALAVEEPIITGAHASFFKPNARVVDLGMPRNVSPALARLRPDISVVNLEYLKSRRHSDARLRKRMVSEAAEIIASHRERYEQFIKSLVGGRPLQ